jgi:putative transposase
MRKLQFAPGEYYHIFNRGNRKQQTFFDQADYVKMLFSLLHFQSDIDPIKNVSRHIGYYLKRGNFGIDENDVKDIINTRKVILHAFTLMPNHFHLLVQNLEEGAISKYLHRVLVSQSKYHNTKNEASGHLFEGAFKAVHVKDNDQLLYLSAYIHQNQREIKGWSTKSLDYPWSSYQDFALQNRWGNLLDTTPLLDQFEGGKDYKRFVEKSGAKNKEVWNNDDFY